jgi:tetratricopeptide (TPR) repeat protein
MDYQEYLTIRDRAARSLASNNYKEADHELYQLLLTDISEIDKAEICIKLAKIHDRMEGPEEALSWFDKGIGYEQNFYRCDVAREKARYLTDLGHYTDAVAIFEGLVKQSFLTEAEKEETRKEIKALLSRSLGQWK